MKHFTLPRFWRCYHLLPPLVQKLANKNYSLLKTDPQHPSLHFKKVRKDKGLWSVRVGLGHRALGPEKNHDIYWFWIGDHEEYDRLIK